MFLTDSILPSLSDELEKNENCLGAEKLANESNDSGQNPNSSLIHFNGPQAVNDSLPPDYNWNNNINHNFPTTNVVYSSDIVSFISLKKIK